ncbi:MAG: hypothetical protein HHJ09_14545 [Glaciimonas sp.]|nr:hypothetical protein [Glaciimonas sp.]
MSVSGISNSGVASVLLNASITRDKPANAVASLAATTIRGATAAFSHVDSASTNASWTTLGGVVEAKVVYAKPLAVYSFDMAWASSPTDNTSALMQKNIKGNSTASWNASSLLDGLGAKLLDRFSTTQSDFSQTVAIFLQDSSKSPDVARAASAQALTAAKVAPNSIDFTIATISGKKVKISISFGGDGDTITNTLSIDVQVEGVLTADEQKAVAQLSEGFEAALDGLGKVPPTVDLSGLIGYDASVLSGVDLSVRETPRLNSELRSFNFHANATQRSFSMESIGGKVAVNVDLSQPEILGTAVQQKEALNDYLSRFDAANQRGHGDSKLIAQFKTAFSQLNSNYPVADELSVPRLYGKDRSVLSGLADFKVSMSGDFTDAAEGRVTTEEGHIEYRASQSTKILGRDKYSGLTLTQTQSASLKSDFVKSRNGAMLDTSTGNYDTYSIGDESSTTTSFTYAKDKLKSASIQRLVKQFEHYQKLVDHKVVEQRDTPRNEATLLDISAKLLPSYKEN